MNFPAISVVLPVYNGEKFLYKAIQSILTQSFTDFELIIINDGSTDRTDAIIQSVTDTRIIYVKNEVKKGLVYSLNKGIDLAKGKYIARMDADDICLPGRFSRQISFMENHEEMAVVASTIIFINEKGQETGIWDLDKKTISSSDIKKIMPFKNCIAHPSVMMRSGYAKEFKYRRRQRNIEDYDLWLRLLNRGYSIAKIEEPLLLYRMHGDSITEKNLKSKNIFLRQLAMKRKFLAHEILRGKISGFTLRVISATMIDFGKAFGKTLLSLFRS